MKGAPKNLEDMNKKILVKKNIFVRKNFLLRKKIWSKKIQVKKIDLF